MADAKLKSFFNQKLTEREQQLAKKVGISVRSGRGTGKDCCLSWVYLWLLICFYFSKGLVTAPTQHQLRDILWSEFNKWIRQSDFLSHHIGWQTERVYRKGEKEERSWFVVARTANVKGTAEEQAEALSGLHEDYMILAVDEASAVPRGVFTPIEGTLTGRMNFAILIGNPTRGNGYFFDTFNSDRPRWENLWWNSEESSIVTRDYIEQMRDKYGRDSNMYRINVLGQFPISDANTLIPYDWVMMAVDRDLTIAEDAPILIGIDVGAGGDETIIIKRHGNVVTDLRIASSADTMHVTGIIMRYLADNDYHMAFIDPIGIGAGVYDRLNELRVARLYPVDVRAESTDHACFRLRDSLFWQLRGCFEKGTIKIPEDEDLIGELTSLTYGTPESTGLIKVEAKKDMRKRGIHSPNRADALALTYYFGDNTYEAIGTMKRKPTKRKGWKVA